MKKPGLIITVMMIALLLLSTCAEGMFGSLEELEEQAIEANSGGAKTYTVTVSPESVLVSRGGSQKFTATVHGDGEPSQEVTWSVTGGGSSTSIDITGMLFVGNSEEVGNILTVTATSTAYNRSGNAKAEVSALVNAQTPTFLYQPQDATFTVDVPADPPLKGEAYVTDGGELSYQWYSNTENSSSGWTSLGSANGAQTAEYTPPTDVKGIVYYYVIVTNTITDNGDGGNKTATATSNTAAVEVNELTHAKTPSIDLQPVSPPAYEYKDTASPLTVEASVDDGGLLSYQWYYNSTASYIGSIQIPGATEDSYTPDTTAIATRYYYVDVTNTNSSVTGNPTATATSGFAEVTVNRKLLTISAVHTKAFNGDTNAIGVNVTFTGMANGETITPGTVTAEYKSVNAGEKTLTITALPLNGTTAANYDLGLPVEVNVSGGITPKLISLNINSHPAHTLIPFDSADTMYKKETTFSVGVASNGMIGLDTVTVGIALPNYGLSVKNNTGVGVDGNAFKTVTIEYDGTTEVTSTSPTVQLAISGNDNYALSGTGNSINVTIIDGLDPDRAIPVTKDNIAAFNVYANTTGSSGGLSRHYKLMEHIDEANLRDDLAGDNNWEPIGPNANPNYFIGSFDGQGYTITGLKIDAASGLGMFGHLFYNTAHASDRRYGTVKNLGLIDCSIKGTAYVGGIAGYMGMNTTIENCFVSGTINGTDTISGVIGGIVGYSNGAGSVVRNCYTEAAVTGINNVGGIIGSLRSNSYVSTVENCYSTGDISGRDGIGGILGYHENDTASRNDKIQYCYATGSISGREYAGGIVGRTDVNYLVITNCVALNKSVTITNNTTNLGRIVGFTSGTLADNYARETGMTLTYNNGGSNYSPTIGLTSKDGDNVAASRYNATSVSDWWSSTVGFSGDSWSFGSYLNPRLPWLKDMPLLSGHPQSPEVLP